MNCAHININSIKTKIDEFELFLEKNNIMLVSLNETKLAQNETIYLKDYNFVGKNRNSRGGGVAICIHKSINYQINNQLDMFDLELIAIDIYTERNKKIFTFISWYLPPNAKFPNDNFFDKLNTLSKVVVCGDLNCKSKVWFSKSDNENGRKLSEKIFETNLTVVKNKGPTFYSLAFNKYDILDVVITSHDIATKIKSLKIIKNEINSDHFAMKFEIECQLKNYQNVRTITRIDWVKMKELSESAFAKLPEPETVSCAYENFNKCIEQSKNDSSKTIVKTVDNRNLPKYLLTLIYFKNYAKKKAKNLESKTLYNKLNKIVSEEIKAFKNKQFETQCENLLRNKPSESKFWKILNRLDKKNECAKKTFPFLNVNGEKIIDEREKCEILSNKLEKTYQPYEDDHFNDQFKAEVETFAKSDELFKYKELPDPKYTDDFTLNELEAIIKSLNAKSAPGLDNISNKIIKNLGTNGKSYLLKIANISFNKSEVLSEWKLAKVTMIPKNQNDIHNPDNYRPISLTNSIIKIIEKLIKNRLKSFLDDSSQIIKYQSGFRNNRSTIDNIFFFKQKCHEAFAQKKWVCGVVFDIEKAFDKVWHDGLFFKMHKMKIPTKICEWIRSFLNERKFKIYINGQSSEEKKLVTGVPQGAILSPILFLIFINDIPTSSPKYYDQYSLLFADDLFHFNSNKNLKYLEKSTQSYLNDLEEWMKKWRLKIATKKCHFNLYKETGIINKEIELKIFDEKIRMEKNPTYLGITLDPKLSFEKHIKDIRERCTRKLNILKVLNNKKFELPLRVKIQVYATLVRSVIEYGAPLWNGLSPQNIKSLESIQYHALRIILKLPIGSTKTQIYETINIPRLSDRFELLHSKYINRALNNIDLMNNLLEDVNQIEAVFNVKNLFLQSNLN